MRPPRAARLIEVDEVELDIEQLVAGGDGLGRFEGIPIFVPRTAPGDRVRIRISERRSDFGRGEVVELLSPGPGRRTPPCPVFARCGGCDLQHLEDERQRALKAKAVIETLRRLGKVEIDGEVPMIAGDPWGYRLRAQIHTGETERGIAVGFNARGSNELVAIESCPVLAPSINALVPKLPRLLRDQPRPRIDICAGDDGTLSVAPPVEGLSTKPIGLTIGDFTYRFDARAFFQAHRGLVESLVSRVVGDWEGGSVYDLYAGVGLFTLPLSRRYERVVAVEGDRIAARYLRQNLNDAAEAESVIENRSVEGWIEALPRQADRVVVDPPRTGLPATVRLALIDRRPHRLTYVSCHAATLARDLKSLLRGFEIDDITFLDLFPQTGHLETVVQLVAKPPSPESPPPESADREASTTEPESGEKP